MKISTRKTIWWYVLAGSVGSAAMFIVICLLLNPTRPIDKGLWTWLICSVICAVVAAARLRRWYREEPAPSEGFWQLSISDLLAAAFFSGLLLSIFKGVWPDTFVRVGIAVSLLTGAHLVAGMLVAARRGFGQKWRKPVFALGFVLRNYGVLGIMTWAALCIVIILYDKRWSEIWEFSATVFFLRNVGNDSDEMCIMYPIRAGIACLPFGLAIFWWLRATRQSLK